MNNKLNVNNPQDIIGTLRIDSTNGNGKLIVNAVGAPNDEDFYVNGLSNLGGTLKAQLIQASSNIETSQQIKSNTINTYSNSNMVIQRNARPYITLDSQEVDSQTVEKIILMKDVEFSGGLSLNTLSVDTLNTVGLNDMVFNVATLGEFLRFQVSDNTVRVPNTRSFLSQNIFSDLIQPLTFSNDVVLYGGNSTNDAYEEYIKLEASTEKVIVNKIIDTSEDIIMLPNKKLYFDDSASNSRYIRTSTRSGTPSFNHLDIVNENSTNGRIQMILNTNGSDTLDVQFIVENSGIVCRRILKAQSGLETNTINTNGDNNLTISRNGDTLITLNSNDQIELGGELKLPLTNQYITFNNCKIREGVAGISYFDFNNEDTSGWFRFIFGDITTGSLKLSIQPTLINLYNHTVINQKLEIISGYGLETNTINSNGDNDLVFQRDGNEFLRFDKFTEDVNGTPTEREAIICSKQLRANSQIRVNNLQINQFSSGVQYTDFRLENAESVMRFYVGNSTSANLQMTNDGISLNRETTISSVKTNIIDTNGDNDLTIRRNGTDVLNIFTYTPTNGPTIIVDAQSDCGISSSWLFANTFANRTGNTDTYFRGAISGGLTSGKVYMTYLHATETLDFDCSIDNTGRSVIGNILDTTVSDERLKTDIEDVDTDFTSCIKNVKVKTFKYKDDKYKTNDNYGFIAQELKEHLPKECKSIVKENKVKNEDETFLSINYMKLSVVLWKCCQETLAKVEHLESSVYELQEQLKEYKKPKAKSKANAKSKAKA